MIKELRINQAITADKVLLIDAQGQSQGIVNIDQALYLAFEAGLDLVEVNPHSQPSVVKIIDYGKYQYNIQKQQAKQKSKSKGPEIKEIRSSFKISEHDLDFKIKQARKFFQAGDKVRLSLRLVGREMKFQQKVREMFEKFALQTEAVFEEKIGR